MKTKSEPTFCIDIDWNINPENEYRQWKLSSHLTKYFQTLNEN
jgi:hypothetical protein